MRRWGCCSAETQCEVRTTATATPKAISELTTTVSLVHSPLTQQKQKLHLMKMIMSSLLMKMIMSSLLT